MCDGKKVEYSIKSLKCDLVVDILTPGYSSNYDIINCQGQIENDGTLEYKMCKSVISLDEEIFGNKYKNRSRNNKPLNLKKSKESLRCIDNVERNFSKTIDGLNDKIGDNYDTSLTHVDVVALLGSYRSLNDSIVKGYYEYITGLLNQVKGNNSLSNEIWEEFLTLNSSLKKIGKNGNETYISEFKAISGAVGHNAYEILDENTKVLFYFSEDGYEYDVTFNILELSEIVNSIQLKLEVYFRALIYIYHLLSSDNMYLDQT